MEIYLVKPAFLRRHAVCAFTSLLLAAPMTCSATVIYGAPGCEFAASFPHIPMMRSAPKLGLQDAIFVYEGYGYRALCGLLPVDSFRSEFDIREWMLGTSHAEGLQSPQMTYALTAEGPKVTARGTRNSGSRQRVESYEEECTIGQRTYMCVSAWRGVSMAASQESTRFLESVRRVSSTPDSRWTWAGEEPERGHLYFDKRSRFITDGSSPAIMMMLMEDFKAPFTTSAGKSGWSVQWQVDISCVERRLRLAEMMLFQSPMASGEAVGYGNVPLPWTEFEELPTGLKNITEVACEDHVASSRNDVSD